MKKIIKFTKNIIIALTISLVFPIGSVFAANITVNNGSYGDVSNTGQKVYLRSTDTHPSGGPVKIDNDNGSFSGWAWSEDLGWIDFAGVTLNQNHKVTGQASVANTNNKIIFDEATYNSNVTIDDNGDFTGFAWSEDLGWIDFSHSKIGTSFPLIKPSSVTKNLQTKIVNGQTIRLIWEAPDDNGGGTIDKYEIRYCKLSEKPTASNPNPSIVTGSCQTQETTNLNYDIQPDYHQHGYVFEVRAHNQAGYGPYSNKSNGQFGYMSVNLNNSNLILDLSPTVSSAAYDTVSQRLTANTNYYNGYRVYLSAKDNNSESRNLKHASKNEYINSLNVSTPSALTNNTWGFRIPTKSSFGDDSNKKFMGMSLLNNYYLVLENNQAATDDLTVEYGAKVDSSISSGDYAQSIVYTIMAQ